MRNPIVVATIVLCSLFGAKAQHRGWPKEVLRRIANGIVAETSYEVIDTVTRRVLNGDDLKTVNAGSAGYSLRGLKCI
ncbi:MAG: hypothetical protein FJ215_07575 [Ignavibacteria bacterium]|nr:hypothetical protein [Ignavibacteria bacterium]